MRSAAGERALPRCRTYRPQKEMGVDYLISIWAGIFAPQGHGRRLWWGKLADALDKALDDPSVRLRINTRWVARPPGKSRAQTRPHSTPM